MPKTPDDYASFLLRLWRAQEQGRSIWRASLESAMTGQRQSFNNLDELITFLKSQFESHRPAGKDKNSGS